MKRPFFTQNFAVCLLVGAVVLGLTSGCLEPRGDELVVQEADAESSVESRHPQYEQWKGPRMQLLRPEQLQNKTRQLFDGGWVVNTTDITAGTTVGVSGFKKYALSLNGIDYNTIEVYPSQPSPMFHAAQSAFCDVLNRQTLEVGATALAQVQQQLDGSDAEDPGELTGAMNRLALLLYGMPLQVSEAYTAMADFFVSLRLLDEEERGGKSPAEILVNAMCSSFPFVYSQ